MKGSRVLLVLLAACWMVAGSAWAHDSMHRKGAFTVSPMVGGMFFLEADTDPEDDWGFGLGLGYNFTERWSGEYMLHAAFTEDDDAGFIAPGEGDDLHVWIHQLNALYHFRPDKALVPYLTAGVGFGKEVPEFGDNHETVLINYGAGLKYFFNKCVALRADIRHGLWSDTDLDQTLVATGGLLFQFGPKPKPAPAAAPAPPPPPPKPEPKPEPKPVPVVPPPAPPMDSDGDGVIDALDKCPDTPKGAFVDEDGCELKMTIHIEFEFDKSRIQPRFHDELKKAADFIKKYEGPFILVAGHTDSIGTEAYNQGLSERRAASVKNYLVQNFNIDGKRLVSRGYGETKPIATNETAAGRQQNRRVEIICCAVFPEE